MGRERRNMRMCKCMCMGRGRDGGWGWVGANTRLILETEEARPAAEHERVVGGDDGDDVDALRLELVVLLQVRREVVHVARRLAGAGSARSVVRGRVGTHREGAGYGEEHNLLPLPLVRGELGGY